MRLSFEAFAPLEEEFITEKAGVPLHLKMELSRLEYEALIEPLLSKTLACVDEALSDSGLTARQIDRTYALMKQRDIDIRRLKLTAICSVCTKAFIKEVGDMENVLEELGPIGPVAPAPEPAAEAAA